MNKESTNLDLALEKFIIAMRLFVSSELKRIYGEEWGRIYCGSLYPNQQEDWARGLNEGKGPLNMIDFGNLSSFAINQKEFLGKFFGRYKNSLPTKFDDIKEARNMKAHYADFNKDIADIAYLNMIRIANILKMNELEDEIRSLKESPQKPIEKAHSIKGGIVTTIPKANASNRTYNNTEIQIKLSSTIRNFSQKDIDKYCQINFSNQVFNINYPLLIKVPDHYSKEQKDKAILDHNGYKRWTWKYEFRKNGYSYAITTQWYQRNDEYVKNWLLKYQT